MKKITFKVLTDEAISSFPKDIYFIHPVLRSFVEKYPLALEEYELPVLYIDGKLVLLDGHHRLYRLVTMGEGLEIGFSAEVISEDEYWDREGFASLLLYASNQHREQITFKTYNAGSIQVHTMITQQQIQTEIAELFYITGNSDQTEGYAYVFKLKVCVFPHTHVAHLVGAEYLGYFTNAYNSSDFYSEGIRYCDAAFKELQKANIARVIGRVEIEDPLAIYRGECPKLMEPEIRLHGADFEIAGVVVEDVLFGYCI